jgi:hypothetical protein
LFRRRPLTITLSILVIAATVLVPASAQADAPPYAFAGPVFGMTAAPDGSLFVADSGAGVVELRKGTGKGRLVVPLPGAADVDPVGNGLLYAITGAGEDATAGKLFRAWRGGPAKQVADLSGYEAAVNPDGGEVDSNPFDVEAIGGGRALVADAGGNDLLVVDHGRTKVLTVFPRHGCGGVFTDECDGHSVPTSLAWGPGGAVYVGELAHFEPGAARVWKVSPWTGKRLGWYGKGGTICRSDTAGFTTVTGVAFGRDGSLYVSELMGGADGGGQVVRISPNCHRSVRSVPLPAGLLVDRHDNVYVSAFSISDSDGAGGIPPGQVWRLRF